MPCNCGNKSATSKIEYVIKNPDGSTLGVRASELEAKRLATQVGGTYTARTTGS